MGVRFDRYTWHGGDETLLRFGPDDGPIVIVALPLFEEANRTRVFAVGICRALADRGIGSMLPDVPGQGESLVETRDATLAAMRAAFASVMPRAAYGVAIRSGALLDVGATLAGRWHLAPQTGSELMRDLSRLRSAGGGNEEGFGGNLLSAELLAELASAAVSTDRVRTVRLDTDPRPADRKLAGSPLWRRVEPGNDADLAQRLADDIADWIATCAA